MSKTPAPVRLSRRALVASGLGLLALAPARASAALFADPAITFERVGFAVEGTPVAGILVRPRVERPLGAVVTSGPWTSVKEQAPLLYATAMARRGFAALAFDHRHFGESGGAPRQLESPPLKVADIRGAVGFLAADGRTAGLPVGALGICAGGGYALKAAAEDERIQAFAGVAATYNDAAATRAAWGEYYDAVMARSEAARRAWEEDGVADVIPAVGPPGADVAMPNPEAFAYYGTPRAGAAYVNGFAVMGYADNLLFDALGPGAAMGKPALVVHSENAMAPDLARRFLAEATGETRALWLASEGQVDFYDDPRLSEPAADAAAAAFGEWLAV